ncbi:2579_t:CDS:1, partial [Dentiscutata heterogama]
AISFLRFKIQSSPALVGDLKAFFSSFDALAPDYSCGSDAFAL